MLTGLQFSLSILDFFLKTGLTSALLKMPGNLAVEIHSLKLRLINSEKNITVWIDYFNWNIILLNGLKCIITSTAENLKCP